MNKNLKKFYKQEIEASDHAFNNGQYAASWKHLERAHIIGQPYPIQHTLAHWKMLCFAFNTKRKEEIIGQLPRLIFGGIKSFVGTIPVGNTGGANVHPLKPMQIPDDLAEIIRLYSK